MSVNSGFYGPTPPPLTEAELAQVEREIELAAAEETRAKRAERGARWQALLVQHGVPARPAEDKRPAHERIQDILDKGLVTLFDEAERRRKINEGMQNSRAPQAPLEPTVQGAFK